MKVIHFEGMKKKKCPEDGYPGTILCPVCKGHGGYKNERGTEFHCSQCNSWGWVNEQDAKCTHKNMELTQQECRKRGIYHAGMCYHVYECLKCGKIESQDSSD